MAVYKRKYNPYAGSLTPERSRFFVLTRYAFAELFKSRAFVLLLILALVPTLFYAGYIFLANNTTAQLLLRIAGDNRERLQGTGFAVDTEFFVILVIVQTQVAFLLNCWVGPVLISGDLTNGALPLFLSRPFSRAEYVLGKLAVLALLLSAVTWIPGLLLFGLQSGLAADGWFWSHLWMTIPLVFCCSIWILMLSLISLAVSAWVKLRIVATGVIFISFFVPAGLGEIYNGIMGTYWGYLLNFTYLFGLMVTKEFGAMDLFTSPGTRLAPEIPVAAAWLMMILVCVFALFVLNVRLRAREVVRG
jgi:ABC-2 type transport system permease protein